MGNTNTESLTGILALWNDCKPGKENLYETWYQGEHLHDRVSIPGFKLGRRHKSVDGTPKYFTYYETVSAEVLFSEAYLHQLDNPSILTLEVMQGVFINASRTVCSCTYYVGEVRGSQVVTARSVEAASKDDAKTIAEKMYDMPGCLRSEVWVRFTPESNQEDNNPRREEQIRGRDARIEWCVVAHALDSSTAEHIREQLQPLSDLDLEIGIYQYLCELRQAG